MTLLERDQQRMVESYLRGKNWQQRKDWTPFGDEGVFTTLYRPPTGNLIQVFLDCRNPKELRLSYYSFIGINTLKTGAVVKQKALAGGL